MVISISEPLTLEKCTSIVSIKFLWIILTSPKIRDTAISKCGSDKVDVINNTGHIVNSSVNSTLVFHIDMWKLFIAALLRNLKIMISTL